MSRLSNIILKILFAVFESLAHFQARLLLRGWR